MRPDHHPRPGVALSAPLGRHIDQEDTMTAPAPAPPLADDLLTGARAIANFLGCKPSRVYRRARLRDGPPIHKDGSGGVWARRSELDAYYSTGAPCAS
jgi:hypothetical protein